MCPGILIRKEVLRMFGNYTTYAEPRHIKRFEELLETRLNGNLSEFNTEVQRMNKRTIGMFLSYVNSQNPVYVKYIADALEAM